jgi:hypothetical protein
MFRLIAIDFSLLYPTFPCELSEREVTSPSNLKVVGALDNYSSLLAFDTTVTGLYINIFFNLSLRTTN